MGKVSFRTLIGYCLSDYEAKAALATMRKPSRKSQLIKVIVVDSIIQSGGRFLRRQKNEKWEVVSVEASREKVGQELRARYHEKAT